MVSYLETPTPPPQCYIPLLIATLSGEGSALASAGWLRRVPASSNAAKRRSKLRDSELRVPPRVAVRNPFRIPLKPPVRVPVRVPFTKP